jgi:hypothetical protein
MLLLYTVCEWVLRLFFYHDAAGYGYLKVLVP